MMTAPELPYVPHFPQLKKLGCSLTEVLVYGALAAYLRLGYQPGESEIAWAANRLTDRHARRALASLVKRNLVRRSRDSRGRWSRNRYELLGPTLEMVEPKGENAA